VIEPWVSAKNCVGKRIAGCISSCGPHPTSYARVMDQDSLPRDLGRRLGDLSNLPDELKSQLQATKVGELDASIMDVLETQLDGVGNVDEILVGIYRKTGEIHKRQYISNKLYRMAQAGMIVSVPKKKGVYRTK
jgi:hypothetical protein